RAAPHGGHPRRCARRLLSDRGPRYGGCPPRAAADAELAAEQRSYVGGLLPPRGGGAGPGAGGGPGASPRGGQGSAAGPQAHLLPPEDAAPPRREVTRRRA